MKEYTHRELDDLIACQKQITEVPKQEMRLEGSQRRNDMRLRRDAGPGEFRVFMRMHDEFNENFTIGLAYNSRMARVKSSCCVAMVRTVSTTATSTPSILTPSFTSTAPAKMRYVPDIEPRSGRNGLRTSLRTAKL